MFHRGNQRGPPSEDPFDAMGGGSGFFDSLFRHMGGQGRRGGGDGGGNNTEGGRSINPMDIIDQMMNQMRRDAGAGEWADDDDAGMPFVSSLCL